MEQQWTHLGLDCEKGDGSFAKIPLDEQIHTLEIGTTGSGKSTLLKLLILQDIEAGRGFCLMDAHGDLAEEVLAYIPPERWKDVVYINPLTTWTHKKVVQFNFLEETDVRKAAQTLADATIAGATLADAMSKVYESMVDRAFIDSIEKVHEKKYWGVRLEEILLNGLLPLRETMPGRVTIHELSAFLGDPDHRRKVLKMVRDKEVLKFWNYTFPKMPVYAETAVETKLFRILQEPVIAPMFDTVRSTINFRDLMDNNKIVIISLPEGPLSKSVISFLGSLLNTRMYLAAMSREDTPEEKRVPFSIYIDESARFMTATLVELTTALRKYGIRITLSVQELQQYDVDLKDVVPSLCNTLCVFACGERTARALEGYFKGEDFDYTKLMQAPLHHFYVISKYWNEVHRGLVETIKLPRGKYDSEEVKKAALEHYGADYDLEKRGLSREFTSDLFFPSLEPNVFFALTVISERSKTGKEEVITRLQEAYGMTTTAANFGLRTAIQRGFVDEFSEFHDAAGHETKRPYYYYKMTELGLQTLYPPLKGSRAGGTTHTLLLSRAMRECWSRRAETPVQTSGVMSKECCAVTITYKGAKKEYPIEVLPDLLVYPPLQDVTREGKVQFDPFNWDVKGRYAVEVEVDPVRHVERVLAHYERAKEVGVPVVFVVSNDHHRDYLTNALAEIGVKPVGDVRDSPSIGSVEIRVFPSEVDADTRLQGQVKESLEKAGVKFPASGLSAPDEEAKLQGEKVPKTETRPAAKAETQPPRPSEMETQPAIASASAPPVLSKDQAAFAKLDERRNNLLEAASRYPVPKLEEKLALIEQERKRLIQTVSAKEVPQQSGEPPLQKEDAHERDLAERRKQRVESLRKDGWVFWEEELMGHPHLYAGKVHDGEPERIYVDSLGDDMRAVLAELGISPMPSCPEQFKKRLRLPEKIEPPQQGTKAEKKIPKPRQPPKRELNLNTVRARIRKYEQEGFKFGVRSDNRLYAEKWIKEKKKKERHFVATLDDQVRDVLKNMKIVTT